MNTTKLLENAAPQWKVQTWTPKKGHESEVHIDFACNPVVRTILQSLLWSFAGSTGLFATPWRISLQHLS